MICSVSGRQKAKPLSNIPFQHTVYRCLAGKSVRFGEGFTRASGALESGFMLLLHKTSPALMKYLTI